MNEHSSKTLLFLQSITVILLTIIVVRPSMPAPLTDGGRESKQNNDVINLLKSIGRDTANILTNNEAPSEERVVPAPGYWPQGLLRYTLPLGWKEMTADMGGGSALTLRGPNHEMIMVQSTMIPTFNGKITTYEQWVAEFASLTGHTLKIGNKVFAEAYGKEPGSGIFWIAKESEGKEDLVTVTIYQAPTLESTLSTLMFERAE